MDDVLKKRSKNDEQVEDIMNQDSNFIKTQEGYPIFFRDLRDSLSKV